MRSERQAESRRFYQALALGVAIGLLLWTVIIYAALVLINALT